MFGNILDRVRETGPLVHNITNYVTVNDVANAILAIGASPVMADDPRDAVEITAICGGINLNIGTLNKRSIKAMHRAGMRASELGHVVLLDPVGAGASAIRTETAVSLLEKLHLTAVRGNMSEVKTLASGSGTTKGVDADVADAVTDENLETSVEFAKNFAREHKTLLAVTGAIDLVTDGDKCFVIRNGRAEMGRVAGTGCQLSGIATAFLIANPDNRLEALAAAVATMGIAGEIGWSRQLEGDGNATFAKRIIDALYHLDGATLDRMTRCEER